MKAVFFRKTGGLQHIEFGELPPHKLALENSQVRVKFLAGSLNHLDLWVLKGLPNLKYQFPQIMGADFCGEVIESASSKFKKGDRVLLYPARGSGKTVDGRSVPENLSKDFAVRGENYPGTFVEEIIEDEKYFFKTPVHLTLEQAAALPLVYLTAWQMLSEKAQIGEGWNEGPVLVHGAGSGVTHALLEILLAFKVPQIAVTSRSEEKLKIWNERGVTTFLWNDKTFEDLKSFCGPGRFAVIFDHIGEKILNMNMKLLRNGGSFVTCGSTSGFAASLDLRQLFFRQLKLLGSTMGSLQHFSEILKLVEKHSIKPYISEVFNWSQAAEAYRLLDQGSQNGKIVVRTAH